jgi:hypothetical protein
MDTKTNTKTTENITMDVSESGGSTTPTPEPTAPVNLTVGCLSNVKNLVDVAISRGAYKPNEVSTVGKIYDEFVAGLKTVTDAATAVAPATAAPADATTPNSV